MVRNEIKQNHEVCICVYVSQNVLRLAFIYPHSSVPVHEVKPCKHETW